MKTVSAACCILVFVLAIQDTAGAINYNTGAKLPSGFYLNIYPFLYTADTLTDRQGNALIKDLDMVKYGLSVSGVYYTGQFIMNFVLPVGQMLVGALRARDSGIGDITLRGGYFLPVKNMSILSALAVKIPTGGFDRYNVVNFGDGQSDIHAELYLNKSVGNFTADWLLKYSLRLQNNDTRVDPGDELITEGLITYRVSEHLRIGPSFSFVSGGDSRWNNVRVSDSGIRKLSLGGELFYRASPKARISFSVLKDVETRNTAEGLLFLGRIAIPF